MSRSGARRERPPELVSPLMLALIIVNIGLLFPLFSMLTVVFVDGVAMLFVVFLVLLALR